MKGYRYPYIPNKTMYAAVMGACSYIRETGYFNKAVSYYAEKYQVDADELAKHIRARQSVGQKGRRSNSTGRKYKWFIVCQTIWCEADGETTYSNPQVLKGLTEETVISRFSESDWKNTVRNDYGGAYAPVYGHKAIAQFDCETDANKALPNWENLVDTGGYGI